jgi:hypothetical protein
MATGVWQPYPVRSYPPEIALQTINSFTRDVRPNAPGLAGAPGGRIEMQPEEVVMAAQRVAVAAASGKRFPRTLDPRLQEAANLILQGKPFVVRSAGRAVQVQGRAPMVAPVGVHC